MARYYLIWLICCSFPAMADFDVGETIDETLSDVTSIINDSYKQCEALYDEIRNSVCANTIFGIFGRMYLKLGVSFTERQLKFQNAPSQEDVFVLSSGSKPRPIFGIALNDAYFGGSNWGYGFGFDYFDDYAFEQVIQRGSDENKASYDLGTYSSMSVIAVSPSVFYSWGRGDASPNRYLKLGVGLNLMYSAVRGTAYETELDTLENAACYSAASDLLSGVNNDRSVLSGQCALQRFRESSYGTGAKIFIVGDWNKWEAELSVSLFNHRGDGEYRFVTQQVLLGLSRKFAF